MHWLDSRTTQYQDCKSCKIIERRHCWVIVLSLKRTKTANEQDIRGSISIHPEQRFLKRNKGLIPPAPTRFHYSKEKQKINSVSSYTISPEFWRDSSLCNSMFYSLCPSSTPRPMTFNYATARSATMCPLPFSPSSHRVKEHGNLPFCPTHLCRPGYFI